MSFLDKEVHDDFDDDIHFLRLGFRCKYRNGNQCIIFHNHPAVFDQRMISIEEFQKKSCSNSLAAIHKRVILYQEIQKVRCLSCNEG